MITPPRKDGSIDPLTCAHDVCNAQEVYKLGGVSWNSQTAFEQKTLGKLIRLWTQGYFVTAKNMVSDRIAIDMVASPTELLVFADSKSHPDSWLLI